MILPSAEVPYEGMSNSRTMWRGFRGVAAVLLILGASCFVINLSTTIASFSECDAHYYRRIPMHPEDAPKSKSVQGELFACAIATGHTVGIVGGILFILTGALGLAASNSKPLHRRSGLKNGFLVLCVLNAMFIGPGCVVGPIPEMALMGFYGRGLVAFFESLLAFMVVVVSVIGASCSCCCTPVEPESVVLVNSPASPILTTSPTSPIAILSHPTNDKARLIPSNTDPKATMPSNNKV